jgi:hypothetical protein
MKLHIADDLSLPLEAVTEKFAWLGRTGSGKSYGAMKLAEEFDRARAQFVVLDPVGMWYGLRLAADGKSPGLQVPVLGGLRGDIPLEPAGGALIADLVVDRGASMILDVSQFESDTAKARFAHDFADRFFFRKKAASSAVHLFIDEAQEFCPQNPQRDEARMLHAFTRMLKLGRNFGIGASLLSQRPQEVNKKCLNLAEVLFAFQLTGPQERKTVDGWIADKGIDEDIAGELPKLAVGHPHVWSPAWLQISRVVHISPRWTFDASSTPKAGRVAVVVRSLTPIDLEKLRTDMAATIEKAKAEDPKLLRQEIARLKANLAKQPAAAPIEVEKIVEKPVLNNGQLKKTEKVIERTESLGQKLMDEGQRLLAESAELRRLIAPAFAPAPPRPAAKAAVQTAAPPAPRPAPQPAPWGALDVPAGEFKMGKCERAVLTALAQNPNGRTTKQIAILTAYSITSGGFQESMRKLRQFGLMTTSAPWQITKEGLAQLGDWTPLPTGPALADYWLRKLPKCENTVLAALLAIYPQQMTLDEIAAQTGYSKTSGGFQESMRNLRTLELITDGLPTGASHEFFQ